MKQTQRSAKYEKLLRKYYPEVAVSGFSRVDNAVEFYTRVNTLIRPEMTVLDFGAGRGQWLEQTHAPVRLKLRNFKGRVHKVLGADVDESVRLNPSVDESIVLADDGRIPLADATVDVIIADFTFEHIVDPVATCAELERVLKPGGWICARTPNKHGYIGVAARVVPNRYHVAVLGSLQPIRKDIDVFPVQYKMNTASDIRKVLRPAAFDNFIYTLPAEPSYAGAFRVLWLAMMFFSRHVPRRFDPILAIFAQKRIRSDTAADVR